VELGELIRQIQTEMERGAYKTAALLCEHALEHAPSCVTAHRLLGECRLEMHEVDAAIEHFQTALNFDPMSVVVRLGMGVAADERHDLDASYACNLHAWEINPGLDHVRDRLVTLRRARGIDSRLHLTRAGLASVHLRAGRYDRAIKELRALVKAEPRARRARCALAEALWRSGEDAPATAVCRDGLEFEPENGRYLAILAEIEHRRQSPEAAGTLARLRAIDPLGEIATAMADWRPDRDVSELFADTIIVPDPVLVAEPIQLEARSAVADAIAAALGARFDAAPAAVAGLDPAIQPFAWDDSLAAAQPAAEPVDVWDDWRNPAAVAAPETDWGDTGVASLDAIKAISPSPFETGGGAIDLTVGWDQLDQALADATPPAASDDQFSELLAELRIEGLAPFDATEEAVDDAAWEPLFTGDPGSGEQEVDWSIPVPVLAAALVVDPMDAGEFGGLEPFSFEEPESLFDAGPDAGFDFSDLDLVAAAPVRSARTSTLLVKPPPAATVTAAVTVPEVVVKVDAVPIGELAPTRVVSAVPAPPQILLPQAEAQVSIFKVLRTAKTRDVGQQPAAARPAPPVESPPVFHVEHLPTPAAERQVGERLDAISRDELIAMRLRLIGEEDSAGEIARTLEATLSDGRVDPLAARVLGEAYLRLGKRDQAAAQFRQAMLSGRTRRNLLGSAAR
jgi:Tfp pilus assembly protein PilF